MNGAASRAVVGRGLVLGYGGCKPPFTAVQWQELEKQTMIYKYLMAGLPVPPDLVRRSDELSARFAPHSACNCPTPCCLYVCSLAIQHSNVKIDDELAVKGRKSYLVKFDCTLVG